MNEEVEKPGESEVPVMFDHDMYALEIEWDRPAPDSPVMPRLVGPFAQHEEARVWARLNIPNGSWNVARLAWPYWRSRPGQPGGAS